MKITATRISAVQVIQPKKHGGDRGMAWFDTGTHEFVYAMGKSDYGKHLKTLG